MPLICTATFRSKPCWLLLFTMLTAALVDAAPAQGDKPPASAEQLPALQLLRGPWQGGTVYRESLFFVKPAEGDPTARLLFTAARIIAVHRADGKQTFEAGKDYQLTEDGGGLTLPEGSRAPFRKEGELFVPRGSPQSIGQRTGIPEISLLFGEGHFFHDQQVEVTYLPKQDARWAGYTPSFADKTLPGTVALLRAKKPLAIAVSGDSISAGANASGFTKAAPHMPPYPDLVAAQLENSYGSKVTLHNRAVGGWSVGQGVKDIDNLLKLKPDLVIIAYGMNDVGGRNPEGYRAAVAKMIDRIKAANAATEIVLVASMLGNPDWSATPSEMFPKYRDALATLAGPGVALADVTAIWQELLKRKRYLDMTGNGVNHPSDYGHRLYAQVILALLVDPALAKAAEPQK